MLILDTVKEKDCFDVLMVKSVFAKATPHNRDAMKYGKILA